MPAKKVLDKVGVPLGIMPLGNMSTKQMLKIVVGAATLIAASIAGASQVLPVRTSGDHTDMLRVLRVMCRSTVEPALKAECDR